MTMFFAFMAFLVFIFMVDEKKDKESKKNYTCAFIALIIAICIFRMSQ